MAERRLKMVVQLSSGQAEAGLKRLGGTMSGVTKLASAFGVTLGAAGLVSFARDVVNTAAAFESLRVQLETVEGSAAAARRTFDGLQQFAATTPFQVDALTRSWVQLRAVGLSPTGDDLRSIGDLAAAFGRNIEDATRAVTSAAFGETEALKSFGIVARSEGEKLKISFGGVEQSVNKDAQSITDALLGIAEANFSGSMERQSETLNGVLSTLDDNVKILKASIGEQLLPAMKDLAKGMITAAKHSGEASAVIRANWHGAAAAILGAAAAESKIRAGLMSLNPLLRGQAKELKAQSEEWERLAFEHIVGVNTALDDYGSAAAKAAEASQNLASSLGGGGGGGGVAEAAQKVVKSVGALGQKLFVPPDKIGNLWFPPGTVDEIVKRAKEGHAEAARKLASQSHFMPPDKIGALWFPPGTAEEIAKAAAAAKTAERTAEKMRERWKRMWQQLAQIAANLLYDALTGGEIDWTSIGEQAGSAMGAAIGSKMGPIGEIFGEAIGAAVGKLLGSLAGGDPNKSQGSFTLSQDFRGQGGVADMQDAFSAALDAMDQILDRIEEITDGALWLSEQMEVIVNKQGDAILKIRDAQGNEIFSQAFDSQQEAMDAGLARLLSTAVLNAEGPLRDAFQEILSNAANAGLEATLESLEKLGSIDEFLQSVDPTFDSTLDRISQFRAELDGMGLSAEVAADILARLQDAENQRLQTLQSGWYSELFQIWERLGVNQTELANERAKMEQLQAKITLQRLKAEAEFYGFLTPALEAIINGLLEAANNIANFQVDVGGVGKIGKIKVGKIGKSGPSKADKRQSLLDEWERFINSGSAVRSFNQDLRDLHESFFGPHGFMARFKELGMSTEEMAAQFARMARDIREQANAPIRDVLRDLQLGTGGFGGASLSQQFFSQQSEFNRLASLAGTDLDARGPLADVARQYIDSIQQMFGNSRRGRALIDQVRGRLEGVVGPDALDSHEVRLGKERNDVLYDIRELLGGPPKEMAKDQKEMVRLARSRTEWARQAHRQAQERDSKLASINEELRKAARERASRPFMQHDPKPAIAAGGTYGGR